MGNIERIIEPLVEGSRVLNAVMLQQLLVGTNYDRAEALLSSIARVIVSSAQLQDIEGESDHQSIITELQETMRRVDVRIDAKDSIAKIAEEALPIFFYASLTSPAAAAMDSESRRNIVYGLVDRDPDDEMIGFGFIDSFYCGG